MREVFVDLVEAVVELLLHLRSEFVKYRSKIGDALVEVLFLRLHFGIARKQVVVVLLRVLVDCAKACDLTL